VATIRNTGTGDARAVLANVRNESGNDVFLRIGRAELGEMKSGDTRKAIFEFEIKKGFTGNAVQFKLSVMDSKTQVYSGEALSFPISTPLQVSARATSVTLRQGTLLRAIPAAESPVVGRVGQDALVTSAFQCNGFLRVDASAEESGWVRQTDTETAPAGATATAVQIEPTLNTPPSIRLKSLPDVTDRPRIELSGTARDDQRVQSIYIFNNNQKVFFQANSGNSARFAMDLDLEPGINFVTVVAEETEELQTRTTLVVRRDGKGNMPFISARDIKGTPEPLGVIPSNAR